MIFYLEENFDGLTEAVKTLEPEKRKICIVTDSTVASYLNPVKAVLEKVLAG